MVELKINNRGNSIAQSSKPGKMADSQTTQRSIKTKLSCKGELEVLKVRGYRLETLTIINHGAEEKFCDFDFIEIFNFCNNLIEMEIRSILLTSECCEMLGKMACRIQSTLQILKLGECSVECVNNIREVLPTILIHAIILE